MNNYASIAAPDGVADTNQNDNNAQVTTPADIPLCPQASVSVTKKTDATSIAPGGAAKYTVTYTNDGPQAADGATINDFLYTQNTGSAFSTYDATDFSCTTTGGAVCPDLNNSTGTSTSYGSTFTSTIPTFPANSTVTITYTDTFATGSATCIPNANPRVNNYASIAAPDGVADTNQNDNNAQVTTPATCAEVAVNSTVSPSSIRAGDPFTYTVKVTNSGSGTANNIAFSDPLVGNLNYVSTDCAATTGTPTCGTIRFDPITKTVSSTIPALSPGDALTFTIHAIAGVAAGTFTNIAKISTTADSTYYDPNPSSDSSRVNLQIFNTTSPVTIVKHIDGLTAAGLPAAATFTGTITCATQASHTWSITVPKGSTTASSNPVELYDGESCTVNEDTPTTAPTGYTWSPTPVIDPGTITPTASTPITVHVTNTLIADPITAAQVVVTKQIDGLPGGLPAAETFTGTLRCTTGTGEATTGTWSVTVPKGQIAADSDPITEPVGSDCTVKENTPPAAPTGYTWTGVGVTPTSTGALTNGQVAAVTVTNTLTAAVTPTADPGSIRISKTITGGPSAGVTGTFTFAVFCGTDVYRTSITITKADKGTATLTGIPNGADCTIQETGKTAAPTGYTWKTAVVSAATVHVTSDDVSDVTVTNPLIKTATGPGKGTGTSGGTGTNTGHSGTGSGANTSLAFTGSNPKLPLLLGVLLLGLGIGAGALGSRRRHRNN
ncbi:hypothetical protein BIU89_12285 [Curtobacterium sp. MCBA15_005]|nr:hypothetical protein BIU89_12285 [Curtobacterium sp. MCBA15_005]